MGRAVVAGITFHTSSPRLASNQTVGRESGAELSIAVCVSSIHATFDRCVYPRLAVGTKMRSIIRDRSGSTGLSVWPGSPRAERPARSAKRTESDGGRELSLWRGRSRSIRRLFATGCHASLHLDPTIHSLSSLI